MIEWARQFAKGNGEDNLDTEGLLALLENPKSKIVILYYREEIKVANVFKIIPNEYGFSGIVGKKYEAIKDYLKWNGLDVAKWTPIVVLMGEAFASELMKEK